MASWRQTNSRRLVFRGVWALGLSVTLVLPLPAMAAGPTPTPAVSAAPSNPPPHTGAGSEGNAVGGPDALQALGTPPSCGNAGPGTITTTQGANLAAVVLYAEAATPSDFRLESSTSAGTPRPQTIFFNATWNEGATSTDHEIVLTNPVQTLVFSIFTPAFGQTRPSNGIYGKVVQEASGVWLLCFEDGNDNDFNDLIVRVWNNQCVALPFDVTDANIPNLHVKYDPRTLSTPTDKDFIVKAQWMADAILKRAGHARSEMADLFGTFNHRSDVEGYNVNIEVNCNGLAGLMKDKPALTGNQDLIILNPDVFRDNMAGYVQAKVDGVADADLPIAGTYWADTVDHELYHTYQVAAIGAFDDWQRYNLQFDYTNIESTAQLSEDLLADSDDIIARTGVANTGGGSYRAAVDAFLQNPTLAQVVVNVQDGFTEYRAGGFLQWLGERYGSGTKLETRVADFARRVYNNDSVRLDAVGDAMGGTRAAALNALRDWWVTELIKGAENLEIWPDSYRLLDESTLHGVDEPNVGGPEDALRYADVSYPTRTVPDTFDGELTQTAALIRRYDVAPGTALLKFTITDNSPVLVIPGSAGFTARLEEPDRIRLAFLSELGGDVLFEPSFLTAGPARTITETYTVPVAGLDSVTMVVVAGTTKAHLGIDVTEVSGNLSMSVGPAFRFLNSVVALARPAVGNVFTRQQPKSAYTAKIDGIAWPISGVIDLGNGATLVLPGANGLSSGQHELEVTYHLGSQSVTESTTFSVGGGFAPSLLSSTSVEIPVAQATGSGLAGDPLGLAAVPVTDDGPVTGATVSATVIDPLGVSRQYQLTDDGSPLDGAVGDGAYAAEAFGTAATGTYQVTFEATGEVDAVPFSVTRSISVSLASGVDTDADGIADDMELRLGLDPNDAADGSADFDLDGTGASIELARGSNPLTSDTDGGGEADGSEIANGSDPLAAADDVAIPTVSASVHAADGGLVNVSIDVTPDIGSVRLFRVHDGIVTDLGLRSGDQVFADGPLASGTYSYRMVGETPTGRRGPVLGTAAVDARSDATAPQASLTIVGGTAVTSLTTVPMKFIDVTGSPTQMRLAESADALEDASWIPYQASTSFQLQSTEGVHVVLAQLRDAAGNVSGTLVRSLTLDQTVPTSTVGPLPAYTLSSFIDIPFVASPDPDLAFVEIWTRSRPTPVAAWSAWTRNISAHASPVLIGLSDGYYEFESVAVDRAGNREALPAVADAAMRVGAEVVNDDVGTTFQGQSQATTGRDGSIGLVWVDFRNSASVGDVYFARRQDPTSTWGPNERVDDAPIGTLEPSVAIDSSGNVYVAWVDARRAGDGGDIYVAKRTAATGVWGPGVLINDDAAGPLQASPSIAVSATGEVIVVWADKRSNKEHVYSARLPAGSSTWSADIRVTSDQTKTKSVPSVAIGSDGKAYVLYQQSGTRNGIWFSSLPLGSTTWASPVQINDTSKDQISPRIAVDSAGRLLAVYSESTLSIWARTRPGGSSTWSAPVVVSTATTSARTPTLSMRSGGVGYVAWTTTAGVMWGARFDPTTGAWGSQVQLNPSGVYSRPAVALTPTLAVVAGEVGTGNAANIRAYPVSVP